jgi:LysR family transcriptional regulator, glycine cleavage system transcriptional activator
MVTSTHLRALQALELAVRTGSLTAAAEMLSITPAAVGQRIKTIEDYLGLDLIVRGRSGIRPTRELQIAMAHLDTAFREIAKVTDLLDFQRVDEIHVVADQDFAELWLRQRLPIFKQANPNICFCINGLGDVPLRLGQSDCEIWFGPPRGSGFEDQLFRDYLLPISSPKVTVRMLARPAEDGLEGFPLLHLDCYTADPASIGWPEWIGKYGHRQTAPGRGIRYAHVIHALEAVQADAGFLLCGLALVAGQLQNKTLCAPFPIHQGLRTGPAYNIAFRRDAARRGQIGRFREWLLDESRKTEELLAALIANN